MAVTKCHRRSACIGVGPIPFGCRVLAGTRSSRRHCVGVANFGGWAPTDGARAMIAVCGGGGAA
ncbi:MAG: hypothetical protein H6Q33_3528 [Deltaproteobacteria bacterium]|nr:hypothetical protein [Deltaproteobacteria bacterium]